MLTMEELQAILGPTAGTPPAAPAAPPPRQPPALAQRQTLAGRLANDPMWAMVGQAASNMGAAQRGQAVTRSPMQAYQAHVNMKQQRAMRDEAMRQKNPFYEYELARARGYIPPDMSLIDYQRAGLKPNEGTAAMRNFQQWLAVNPNATEKEKQQAFNRILRSGQIVQLGGGGVGVVGGVSGDIDEVVDPTEATQREAGLSGARKSAELIAQTDNDFRVAAASLPEMEQSLADTKQLLADIESGKFQDTGFFEGRVMQIRDADTAELAARATLQALKNLQITNLAPVTENEIRMIENLYASVLKDPEGNIGSLRAAIKMIENKIKLIDQMGQYWVDNDGTLRDYSIGNRWQRTPPDADEQVEMEL